jgi:hypothetical protein
MKPVAIIGMGLSPEDLTTRHRQIIESAIIMEAFFLNPIISPPGKRHQIVKMESDHEKQMRLFGCWPGG